MKIDGIGDNLVDFNPFAINLKQAVDNSSPKPFTINPDPGSKFTGIAMLEEDKVVWASKLEHRGWEIKNYLEQDFRCVAAAGITKLLIVMGSQPRFDRRKQEEGGRNFGETFKIL